MFQILKHITQLPLPIAILLLAGECVPWLISMGSQPTGEVIVTLLFAGLAASLMVFFFRETTIVHDLDYLPAVLYMGAMAVFPSLHTGWEAQLVVLVLIGLVALLYRGFRQKDSPRDAFTATLIMLLSSLLIPDIIWLVPGIWIAYMLLSSFNFRTLLATLIAIGTFALYVGLAIWQGWMQNPYAGILDRHWIFEVVDAEEWLMPVVLAGLGLYYFIFAVVRSERESIRQRTVLMLCSLFYVPVVVMCVWPTLPLRVVPVVLALLTGLGTIFYRQKDSVHRGIVFLIYWLLLIAVYIAPSLIID